VEETVIITGQLMIGIISARALGMALSLLDIPRSLSIYVSELPMSPYVVWAFIVLIYMVLGCLVDGIDLLIISIPVFYPIMTSGLGFDPIWFGVTITVLMELSLITPPVGFNIFITHSISGESNMMETIKGAFPFVIIMLLFIMIVTIFPGLATYLPGRM
jgi:C4-dicarboxylate transporter DctM subunit